MGIFASRSGVVTEDVTDQTSNINPLMYRYPPKQGNYFSNYFIMGGERFEVQQPEAYLFGDNSDLNFLGNHPVPFPYSAPQTNEPTKTLRALVNIRKESVRFVRPATTEGEDPVYTIEFVFDSDVSCSVTIYFGCAEEVMTRGVRYVSRTGSQPETFHYKPGAAQVFSQPTVVWSPSSIQQTQMQVQTSLHPSGQLMTRVTEVIPGPEGDIIPVVIVCQAEEGDDPKQHQATYCLIEHSSDGSFVLKALKQKLYVDNLAYLLQDIYGIENKLVHVRETAEEPEAEEGDDQGSVAEDCEPTDDDDEGGGECVICMSEPRDTLILPCRHLCLCQMCADSLRYQANNCPICRAPFRALLQIRALRKLQGPPAEYPHIEDCVPIGYEAVSLLEALNGLTVAPRRPRPRRTVAPVTSTPIPEVTLNTTVSSTVPLVEETVINVNEEGIEPPSSTVDDPENDTINEESTSESFVETINSGSRVGWSRMQNGRRSLGAVSGESPTGSVSVLQGPLRRTRSAHTRRPLTNPSASLLGPRGATSPSLRSSGDSCSSADSTRRLVKPSVVPNSPPQ